MSAPALDPGDLTCPNAPPGPGASLFGITLAPGKTAYISPVIPLTQELADSFESQGIPIENRLRLAGRCMGAACVQWGGVGRCTLADKVVSDPSVAAPQSRSLPSCGIRSTCRWFSQHKQEACYRCPEVIRKPAELYEQDSTRVPTQGDGS